MGLRLLVQQNVVVIRMKCAELFYTISDGQYKDILYKEFTKERVDRELDEFLDEDFFPRYGGGIGVTHDGDLEQWKISNLLEDNVVAIKKK